ncbi:MAG: hypothetical protein GF383_00345 [Candidatus Lokiarchaeota archaeon]|nr:hypothetical protein [Candidatus Lokiarchaeota archaeon]MBD3337592.1 hypothetical protein [Candidatus Lokiarchaeota archaeon]
MDLEKWNFLVSMEKYYEYNHFSLDELARTTNLKLEEIGARMGKYLGWGVFLISNDKKYKNLKNKHIGIIHERMIQSRIIPRELSIIYALIELNKEYNLDFRNLDSLHKKSIQIEIKKILKIMFPEEEERRSEINGETIDLVAKLLDLGLTQSPCKECEQECILRSPVQIYHKMGMEVTMEDIEGDLIFKRLKEYFKEDFMGLYGFCLLSAINQIIKTNFVLVKDFLAGDKNFADFSQFENYLDLLQEISFDKVKSYCEGCESLEEIINFIRLRDEYFSIPESEK